MGQAIQNLEILVDVDIGKAIASLTELQDELRDLAEHIEGVDARGAKGVNVDTDLESITDDLAELKAQIEAFEKRNDIDIRTNTDSLPQLFAAHNRDPLEIIGRADLDIEPGKSKVDFADLGNQIDEAARSASKLADTLDAPNLGMGGGDGRRGILSRSMGKLGSSIGDTITNLDNMTLRMSSLHNLLANIMPFLVILVGALPMVVTGLVALGGAALGAAAALAAITALGAMGFAMGDSMEMPGMEDFAEIMETVRDSFFEAFAPLAQRLSPIFEDALHGLTLLFENIAAQGDALMELTDMARGFGQFMLAWIPGLLRTFSAGIQAMEPLFGDLATWLKETQLVRRFTKMTLEAYPALKQLAGQILSLLSTLQEMSKGFLVVLSVVGKVISAFWTLITFGGLFSDETAGLLIASLIALRGALALAAFTMNTFVGRIWAAIYSQLLFSKGLTAKVIPALARAIQAIYAKIAALIGYQSAQLSAASATMIAAGALATFLTLASLGVLAGLASAALAVGSDFMTMADGIKDATSAMKEFDETQSNIDGGKGNPYGNAPDSGAAAPGLSGSRGKSGDTFIESSGDGQRDRSNQKYGQWLNGRTTGSSR